MAIQMRRGLKADLDTSKLVAGEIVVATDSNEDYIAVAKAPSSVVQLATKNDVTNAVSGLIDDTTTSSSKTWSSTKIASEISGGGGGGDINYSLLEQDTGITWLDGSHIYQKTISTTAVKDEDYPESMDIDTGVTWDKLISVEGFIDNTNADTFIQIGATLPAYKATISSTPYNDYIDPENCLFLTNVGEGWLTLYWGTLGGDEYDGLPIYITIRYTKPSNNA